MTLKNKLVFPLVRKMIGIATAFVVITVIILFVPAFLFQPSAPVVLSSLPGYVDPNGGVLGVSNNSTATSAIPECVSCKNATEEDIASDLEPVSENETSSELEVKDQSECVLEKETTTKDYRIYQEGGTVFLEITGKVNSKNVWAAYNFIRQQGCVLADSNLEWIY